MRSLSFLLASMLVLCHMGRLQAQTYIPAGVVSGTWDSSGSPYLVEGNINVPLDSQLYVGPGTQILFLGPYQMQVYGYLNASGTATDSIFFSCPDSVDSWGGVRLIDFVSILPDSVRLSYCSFSDVRKDHPDSLGGAFFAKNSPRVSVDHCLFISNYGGSGGAIYLRNSSVLVRNTIIRNNEAERGGGIYIHQSSPRLHNLEVKENTGTVGGGIYYYNSGGVFSSSSISNNTSLGGGGGIILHKMSDVNISECEILYNTANGSGGGIAMLEGSVPVIEFCKISYNTTVFDQFVAKGGGLFITQFGNFPSIENTEISYNLSADDGGGIYTESPINIISSLLIHNESNASSGFGGGGIHAVYNKCLVLNCTFSSNMAQQGSAIYATGANIDIINTIIWDDDISGVKKVYMRNFLIDPVLKVDYSNLEGGEQEIGGTGIFGLIWGENNIDEDPVFTDPLQGDYSLDDVSPCINSGLLDTLAFLLTGLDIAMNPRVNGRAVDMGSYENQSPVFIAEFPGKERIIDNIYPVPASDHVFIKLSPSWASDDLMLYVFSASGQLIMGQQIRGYSGPVRVGLNDIPSGLYVIHVQNQYIRESASITISK